MRRELIATAGAVLLAGVVGQVACVADDTPPACVGAGCITPDSGAPAPTTDPGSFKLTADLSAVVIAGKTAAISVTVERDGFNGAISFSIEGAAKGVSAAAATIAAGATTTTLQISATADAAQGRDILEVIAADSNGGHKQNASTQLLVRGDAQSIDASFGDGAGFVEIPGGSSLDILSAMITQADDKTLVAATIDHDFAALRLDYFGKVDDFGIGGRAVTDFQSDGGPTEDFAGGIALMNDGRIVMGGYTVNPSSLYAVARFKSNGSLDPTFSDDGQLFSTYSDPTLEGDVLANDTAVTSFGQPLIAGRILGLDGNDHMVLGRFTAEGKNDSGFGNAGFSTDAHLSASAACLSIAISPTANGPIACGGFVQAAHTSLEVYRVKADGSPDNDFGGNGVVGIDLGVSSEADAIRFVGDDAVLIGGNVNSAKIVLAQWTKAGAPDMSFGSGGNVQYDFGGAAGVTFGGIATDRVGNIYVVARTARGIGNGKISIARFTKGGTLDTTFHGTGSFDIDVPHPVGLATRVAITPDDQLIVVGTIDFMSSHELVFYRYWI